MEEGMVVIMGEGMEEEGIFRDCNTVIEGRGR